MTILSIISIALSFLLAFMASYFVIRPLFSMNQTGESLPEQTRNDDELQSRMRRENIMDELSDLEVDHRSKKIGSEEFKKSRHELEVQLHQLADADSKRSQSH